MRTTGSLQAFLSGLGKGAIELVFFLPILLAAAVYLLPGVPASAGWWAGSLLLCYAAPILLIGERTSLRRIVITIMSGSLGFLHAACFLIAWAGEVQPVPLLGCGLIAAVFAAKGAAAHLKGWTSSFPAAHMAVGIGSYIVVQLLKLAWDGLAVFGGIYIIGGIISIILVFLIANERLLNHETVDSKHSPSSAASKRKNRLMIAVLIVVMTLIGLFKQIQDAVGQFFRSILGWLIEWLNRPRQQKPVEDPIPDSNPNLFLPMEAKDPSAFMQLLELIIKVLMITVSAAVVAILFYFLIKKMSARIKAFISRLMARNEKSRHEDGSFTDEVESLMTLTKLRHRMGGRLSDWLRRKKTADAEWKQLSSNGERLRYLYAQLLRSVADRGYKASSHLTPRETADDIASWNLSGQQPEELHAFVKAYEQVRYGEMQPDSAEVERLKRQLEQSRKNVPK